MSAPTEYLAEFLSAVMLKDYGKALKYCKLILDFEPNNVTAQEFYPLIEEKLRVLDERSSSDEKNYNVLRSAPEYEEETNIIEIGSSSDEAIRNRTEDNSSNESDYDAETGESGLLEEEDDEEENADDECEVDRDENASLGGAEATKLFPDLNDLHNGNYETTILSDSVSPTEPLTQRLAAMFRAGFSPFDVPK